MSLYPIKQIKYWSEQYIFVNTESIVYIDVNNAQIRTVDGSTIHVAPKSIAKLIEYMERGVKDEK